MKDFSIPQKLMEVSSITLEQFLLLYVCLLFYTTNTILLSSVIMIQFPRTLGIED